MARYAVADMEIVEGRPTAALDTLDLNIPQGALSYGIWGVDWHCLRARAFRAAGEWDKAVEEWQWLLRIYGGHALAHYELGKLFEEMERVEEAAMEYETFLKMWSEADEGLSQLVAARQRLMALKDRSN
jgi:tetratricopeptide (TPR) repeat protein